MTRKIAPLSVLIQLAGIRRSISLALLSLLVALCEGTGFAMLVPLLAAMGDDGSGMRNLLGGWIPQISLLTGLGIVAALVALRAIAEYLRSIAALNMSVAVVDGLRARAVNGLIRAEWRALSQMEHSANRALLISAIDRAGDAADALFLCLRIILALLAIGAAAFLISPIVAAAALVAGILVLAAYAGLRRKAAELGREMERSYSGIYRRLEEALGALRLIKLHGKEEQSARQVTQSFAQLRANQRQYLRITGRARVIFEIAAAAALCGLVYLSLEHWDTPLPVLLPLVALFARAVTQIAALQSIWQIWSHNAPTIVSAASLIADTEDMAEPQASASENVAAVEANLEQELKLADISLELREGTPLFTSLHMTIAANSCTALVGPSGAGKSTLADLLSGLISPDAGSVLLDGQQMSGALRSAWRRRVVYVQQDAVLFSGSVRDNLRWADPVASDAEMAAALKQASASFVFDLPDAIDCELGEAGRQLSGGERQRIALARALLLKPQLLILDEATSALDDQSETAIAQAIASFKGTMTILIIAHRGALTSLADDVYQLDNGALHKLA